MSYQTDEPCGCGCPARGHAWRYDEKPPCSGCTQCRGFIAADRCYHHIAAGDRIKAVAVRIHDRVPLCAECAWNDYVIAAHLATFLRRASLRRMSLIAKEAGDY